MCSMIRFSPFSYGPHHFLPKSAENFPFLALQTTAFLINFWASSTNITNFEGYAQICRSNCWPICAGNVIRYDISTKIIEKKSRMCILVKLKLALAYWYFYFNFNISILM